MTLANGSSPKNRRMPKGVKKVIRSETEFIVVVWRTQLFIPADIDNVIKIQDGYKLQTLSAFLGTTSPPAAPVVDFTKPLTREEQKTSLAFFNIVNFVPIPVNEWHSSFVRRVYHGFA